MLKLLGGVTLAVILTSGAALANASAPAQAAATSVANGSRLPRTR